MVARDGASHGTVAFEQADAIMSAPNALELHYGDVASDLARTTVCADRAVSLLQTITGTQRHVQGDG